MIGRETTEEIVALNKGTVSNCEIVFEEELSTQDVVNLPRVSERKRACKK